MICAFKCQGIADVHTGGIRLLFKHKSKSLVEFHVDLGDLQGEKEQLASFLQAHLKGAFVSAGNKLTVSSEKLSAQELQRVATKFVYHRNFNLTHWVSIEGTTVRINRFKNAVKKTEKHKKNAPHKNAIQTWGI